MDYDASSASASSESGLPSWCDGTFPPVADVVSDNVLAALPEPTPYGAPFERQASRERTAAQFVVRLYELASDPAAAGVVEWSSSGLSFVLTRTATVGEQLARYFDHGNCRSLLRQLNMYRFSKIGPPAHFEYAHPFFRRGHPSLLPNIQRKNPRQEQRARSSATRRPSGATATAAVPASAEPRAPTASRTAHLRATASAPFAELAERAHEPLSADQTHGLGAEVTVCKGEISDLAGQVDGLRVSCARSASQLTRLLDESATLRGEVSSMAASIMAMAERMQAVQNALLCSVDQESHGDAFSVSAALAGRPARHPELQTPGRGPCAAPCAGAGSGSGAGSDSGARSRSVLRIDLSHSIVGRKRARAEADAELPARSFGTPTDSFGSREVKRQRGMDTRGVDSLTESIATLVSPGDLSDMSCLTPLQHFVGPGLCCSLSSMDQVSPSLVGFLTSFATL